MSLFPTQLLEAIEVIDLVKMEDFGFACYGSGRQS